MDNEYKKELVTGLIYGLIAGLVAGLVIQIIAFVTSNPLFSALDFWLQLILLILIQAVGWHTIWNLKEKEK